MFTINITQPKYSIGQEVYYPFQNLVVKGLVKEIKVIFEDNKNYVYYTLLSYGKEYNVIEKEVFSDAETAEKIVIENLKNMIERKKMVIIDLKSSLEKLLLCDFEEETKKDYKTESIFGHTFKVFEKEEEVYFFVNPFHLVERDSFPVFKGKVFGYTGNISTENNNIYFEVESDEGWSVFRPSPDEIFYTKKEAVEYAKKIIEKKIENNLEKIKEIENSIKFDFL